MRLNKYLHFIGNKAESTIEFVSLRNRWKNKLIEVEKFDAVWKFLSTFDLLTENNICPETERWLEFLSDVGAVSHAKDISSNPAFKKLHAVLDFLNVRSSKKLEIAHNKVFIIGLGTIGASLAAKLIEHGVKNITLCDHAVVKKHNVGVQRFYRHKHIGENKAVCLAHELKKYFCDFDILLTPVGRQLTLDDFAETEHHKLTIFLAADELTEKDIAILVKCLKQGAKIVRSGYGIFMCGVSIYKTAQDFEKEQKRYEYEISENIGSSVEGDICASLMVRAWLAEKYLGIPITRLSFDCFLENGQAQYREYLNLSSVMHNDKIQLEYIKFIKTGNEKHWNNIIELDSKSDFIENDDSHLANHMAAIQSCTIEVNGQLIPVEKIVEGRLSGQFDPEIEKQINHAIMKLHDTAFILLKSRKPKKELNSSQRKLLDTIKDFLLKEVFGNKIDFADYQPFAKKGVSFKEAIKIVEASYGEESIRHLTRKPYFDKGTQSVSIYRYYEGKTYSFVNYQEKLVDLLAVAHELAHSYYNAHLSEKFLADQTDLFAETGAMIGEVRLLKYLKKIGKLRLYNKLARDRFSGILLGHYSLVYYREEIYRLIGKKIKWDVIDTRNKVNALFLKGVSIKNAELSDFNVLTSLDFLSGEALSVYIKALVYSFAIYEEYETEYREYLFNEKYILSFERFLNFADLSEPELFEKGCVYIQQELQELVKA